MDARQQARRFQPVCGNRQRPDGGFRHQRQRRYPRQPRFPVGRPDQGRRWQTTLAAAANTYGDTTVNGGVLLETTPAAAQLYGVGRFVVNGCRPVGGSASGPTGYWSDASLGTLVAEATWAASGASLAIDTTYASGNSYTFSNTLSGSIRLMELGSEHAGSRGGQQNRRHDHRRRHVAG